MALSVQSRRSLLFSSLSQAIQDSPALPRAVPGGVRLIAHDDAEFESRVTSGYPQIANSELYTRAKKFMAFLRHDGTATAKAYCVLWTIQQSLTRQRTMSAMYIHKHSMPKMGERKMEPGTERLISPFFNLSAADYNSNPKTAALRIPGHFPFLDADVVSVSIDAMIYGSDPMNATIAGPDAYDLRSQYLATRYAEHDEGVSVLSALQQINVGDPLQAATATQEKIQQLMQKHIDVGASWQGSTLRDRYIRSRAQEAAIMAAVLSAGGLTALKAEARRRSFFPRDVVNLSA